MSFKNQRTADQELKAEIQSLKLLLNQQKKRIKELSNKIPRLNVSLEQQIAMNRRKNVYLIECNMYDDFYNWYRNNYVYEKSDNLDEGNFDVPY